MLGSSSSLCLGCALLTDDLPVEEDSESDGEEGIDLHEDFGDGLGDHDDDGRAWATGRRTSTAGQGGGGDGDDSMEDSSDGEEVDRLGPQFELHNFVPPSVEKVRKTRRPTTPSHCFCRSQYLTNGRGLCCRRRNEELAESIGGGRATYVGRPHEASCPWAWVSTCTSCGWCVVHSMW